MPSVVRRAMSSGCFARWNARVLRLPRTVPCIRSGNLGADSLSGTLWCSEGICTYVCRSLFQNGGNRR